MPYGTILSRNRGSLSPVMRGIGIVPAASSGGNATFGASNDRPIIAFASGSVFNVRSKDYAELVALPAFSATPQNWTGWKGVYPFATSGAWQPPGQPFINYWRPGLPALAQTIPPDLPAISPGTGIIWGTPTKLGVMGIQEWFPPAPQVLGVDYNGTGRIWEPWEGPDTSETQFNCPSWTDGSIDTFLQDGLAGSTGYPSLITVSRDTITYNYLVLDNANNQALLSQAILDSASQGLYSVVKEGYLFKILGTSSLLLLSGDGSYYKIFTMSAADDVASQMLANLNPNPAAAYAIEAVMPFENSFYFYSPASGPITPQVLVGDVLEQRGAIYSFGAGCWPCTRTAQGIQ